MTTHKGALTVLRGRLENTNHGNITRYTSSQGTDYTLHLDMEGEEKTRWVYRINLTRSGNGDMSAWFMDRWDPGLRRYEDDARGERRYDFEDRKGRKALKTFLDGIIEKSPEYFQFAPFANGVFSI